MNLRVAYNFEKAGRFDMKNTLVENVFHRINEKKKNNKIRKIAKSLAAVTHIVF